MNSGRFLLGANLPWLTYGCDFGGNLWHPDGGLAAGRAQEILNDIFSRLKRHGIRAVRWFMLCDGRAGVRFEPDGTPLGLDQFVFADLDVAIEVARHHRLALLLTILDFLWFGEAKVINGVQIRGRRDVVCDPQKRQALLDRVIAPILQRHGYERVIAAWDVINEPEWATFGVGSQDPALSVRQSEMKDFIRTVVQLVHRDTRHQATVGLASAQGLDLVKGLGLDFYQVHWYDHLERFCPLATPVTDLALDRPILLGEFPTKTAGTSIEKLLETARACGYCGAFFWSALAHDSASDYAGAERMLASWMHSNKHTRSVRGTEEDLT